jgi:hypothetical protein
VEYVCSLTPDAIAVLRAQARPDASVLIEKRLLRMVGVIALASDGAVTAREYIESVLRPIVEQRYREALVILNRRHPTPADAPSED